ncbi:MAG TPA: hypothetical protein VHE32_12080, partial [Rhodanobacteraceae bacterium]|nr:hypothetical protein [Rhodanobacteraceae bacterium]
MLYFITVLPPAVPRTEPTSSPPPLPYPAVEEALFPEIVLCRMVALPGVYTPPPRAWYPLDAAW